jgi:hypothetical protein
MKPRPTNALHGVPALSAILHYRAVSQALTTRPLVPAAPAYYGKT